jgi:hypothetical protein
LTTVKGAAPLNLPLQDGADGSWNLTLRLAGLNKIVGTGIVRTPTESLGMDLTGKFQSSFFNIKGVGANDVSDTVSGKGMSAKVQIDSDANLSLFNGKVLGQKLSFGGVSQTPE